MTKLTIREVAAKAGVGIGTVSRVLNNSPHVSRKTRQHVMHIIEVMGFKPNAVARQLPRKTHFRTIGVITPAFNEYYSFAERLRGLQKALAPHQDRYELALYNAETQQYFEQRFVSIIENSMLDGLLIIDFNLTQEQKHFLRQHTIPFCGLNHFHAGDWPCIGTDNEEGGYLATQHLIELGHRAIAYVGNELIDHDGIPTSRDRFRGYRRALEQATIAYHPQWTRLGRMGYEEATMMTANILENATQRPTAVFAMSDTQALGCIAAIREAGLRVPEDISVIGYDDVELSYHTNLSTVRQHLEQSGAAGLQYLLGLIENKPHNPPPTLPPLELVRRGTTREHA